MLYPETTETRTVTDLNGVWNFALCPEGQAHDFTKPLENPLTMAVPASYNDQGVWSEIRNHDGYVLYERDFFVNAALLRDRLNLRFDAATHEAWVYVNGQAACHHKGGFLPFEVEINDLVQPGRNRVTVLLSNILDNSTLPVGKHSTSTDASGHVLHHVEENFDFFNYAGLHRYVRLFTRPASYIEDIVIRPDIDFARGSAEVHVMTRFVGQKNLTVHVTLLDEDGQAVAEGSGNEASLTLDPVRLWEPLDAYLYTAQVDLLDGDQLVDRYYEDFGVRSVRIDGTRFLINEKPFYFKGTGKHEDSYINGRGINEAYNVADIRLLKWLGANSIRTSHYPYSEEMMRLCDREGIVVIDEIPAVGLMEGFTVLSNSNIDSVKTWSTLQTQEAHEEAIHSLIDRDKNHAAVVAWCLMNEPDSASAGAKDYFSHIFAYARPLDPQKRPFVYVNFQGCDIDTDSCMEVSDMICLNRYFGWYWDNGDLEAAEKSLRANLEAWHAKYPDKPIMFTEYGADTVAGLHAIDDIPFTEDYQVAYYEMNSRVFDDYDFFVGEQVWNFADFETTTGVIRVQGNKKGIFTRGREPKAAARWLKKRWESIPSFGYKGGLDSQE